MIEILKAGFIVSILAFAFLSLFYGNPLMQRFYKISAKTGVMKTWKKSSSFFGWHYGITLIETIFFAWIFSIITIHPTAEWLGAGLYFGLFLFLIRILPRAFDFYLMINYPMRLLLVEIIGGLSCALITGVGISYFLYK